MDGLATVKQATVVGPLNYLAASSPKPVSYTYEPPAGVPWRSGVYEPRELVIADARPLIGRLSLDREGFELHRQPTATRNFFDKSQLRNYLGECERLVAAATGASRVVTFDHNIRSGSATQREQHGLREPVTRVHNDYTVRSGPQRVRDVLPEEAEHLLAHRFAFVNVWRPIRGPLRDHPLAICDATTMEQKDFAESDLVYRDRTGETYAVRYSPRHRWFYVPDMQPDEAMLIKCYDSRTDGTARFTAHSAFPDPTAHADVLPRESIEVRTIAFFAPSA
jgi:hypothetical protein